MPVIKHFENCDRPKETKVALSEPGVNQALELQSIELFLGRLAFVNRHMIARIGWVPTIP